MSALLAVVAAVSVWRLLVRRPWPGRLLTRPGMADVRSRVVVPRARPGGPVRRAASAGRRPPEDPTGIPEPVDDPPDLAGVADLLAVAMGAGLAPGPAIEAVAAASPGPTGAALRRAAGVQRRGVPVDEALDALSEGLGAGGRELATVLRSAARSGTAAAPALRTLAATARRRGRRRVEARVRRLPVVLAVPLVLFVLPAFVVLTLVPVALTVAGELREVAAPTASPPVPLAARPAPPRVPEGP
ncbi:MAG: type II secretion system F family protein [Microthrixaceae bacterium]